MLKNRDIKWVDVCGHKEAVASYENWAGRQQRRGKRVSYSDYEKAIEEVVEILRKRYKCDELTKETIINTPITERTPGHTKEDKLLDNEVLDKEAMPEYDSYVTEGNDGKPVSVNVSSRTKLILLGLVVIFPLLLIGGKIRK